MHTLYTYLGGLVLNVGPRAPKRWSWGPQSGGPEAFWRQLGAKGDPRGLILTPFSDISPSINVGGTGRQAAGNIGV